MKNFNYELNTWCFEFTTWHSDNNGSTYWKTHNEMAEIMGKVLIERGAQIWTVAIGQWGVNTYLVAAPDKETAKKIAVDFDQAGKGREKADADMLKHVVARNVTNCKKYQPQ